MLKKYPFVIYGIGIAVGLISIPLVFKRIRDDLKYGDADAIDLPPINNTAITSPYGWRWGRMHNGWDLRAKSGSNVYAVADAVVKYAKNTEPNGCGGYIQLNHKDGLSTKYCHLKKFFVKKGDKVTKGQVIGLSGGGYNDPMKGNSMGDHLHYEVLVDGKAINPKYVHKNIKRA